MTAALLLAAGLAGAAPGPAKEPAAAAAPQAPPFAEIVRCGEAPGGWCVSPEFPPEKTVLVFGKACRGVTKARSRVEWTDCKRPDVGDLAAVGARLEGYRPLKRAPVEGAELERLEGLVRAQPGFARRLAQAEAQRRKAYEGMDRPYPGAAFSAEAFGGRGFYAVFDGEALPHVVAGRSRVTPAGERAQSCGSAVDGFLAGGKAWLRARDCVCGGGCRPVFFPLD